MTSYRDYQSTSYNASSSSGGGGGGGAGIETDFTKLSTTVANSVQKISNNGSALLFFLCTVIIIIS